MLNFVEHEKSVITSGAGKLTHELRNAARTQPPTKTCIHLSLFGQGKMTAVGIINGDV